MATIGSIIKIRAKIIFCGVTVETPYIMSFNVRRTRGQMCGEFSASVRIPVSTSLANCINSKVEIFVGEGDLINQIFTGYIRKMDIRPSREDASFFIANIAGRDVLSVLEGQTFTRRVSAYRMARFGAITDVVRENESFKERFPAKIYSSESRLTDHPILDGMGQITYAPAPPFATVDTTGVGGLSQISVKNVTGAVGP